MQYEEWVFILILNRLLQLYLCTRCVTFVKVITGPQISCIRGRFEDAQNAHDARYYGKISKRSSTQSSILLTYIKIQNFVDRSNDRVLSRFDRFSFFFPPQRNFCRRKEAIRGQFFSFPANSRVLPLLELRLPIILLNCSAVRSKFVRVSGWLSETGEKSLNKSGHGSESRGYVANSKKRATCVAGRHARQPPSWLMAYDHVRFENFVRLCVAFCHRLGPGPSS